MDKNKRVQLIVIVGLVLTIISLFLTLYKASFLGENVSDSIYNAYKSQGRTGTVFLFLIAPILATLFGLWALLTSTFKDEFKGYKVEFSYGPGFYVGLIGAIVIVVGGIVAVATKAFKEEK